jgi:hypothetical protein
MAEKNECGVQVYEQDIILERWDNVGETDYSAQLLEPIGCYI